MTGIINTSSLVGLRPEVIAPYLRGLFREFDQRDIEWAVMRGWGRLPEWTRYDVDILVVKADVERAVVVVKDVAEKVQAHVKEKIQNMTGTAVTQVNVVVADIELEEKAAE